jgi:hypothetical protein
MAEWKMLRQVISPSEIYANAESMVDLLREQYGSYDADSLEEVMVDEAFTQRLKERGYELLGEGAPAETSSFGQRRDGGRMEGGPSAPMRRPGMDRSLPMRRAATSDGVPMRRRDGASDGGVPLRRSERGGETPIPRRREGPGQSDGMSQMRRRDGIGQGDGAPSRRRDMGGQNVDAPMTERTPRRGWDNAREEAAAAARRESTPLMPPTAPGSDALDVERPSASPRGRAPTPRVESPVEVTPPVQDLAPPVVEAPTPMQPVASAQTEAPVTEAPTAEAPAAKPAPRTRRTTRSRAKADPEASDS